MSPAWVAKYKKGHRGSILNRLTKKLVPLTPLETYEGDHWEYHALRGKLVEIDSGASHASVPAPAPVSNPEDVVFDGRVERAREPVVTESKPKLDRLKLESLAHKILKAEPEPAEPEPAEPDPVNTEPVEPEPIEPEPEAKSDFVSEPEPSDESASEESEEPGEDSDGEAPRRIRRRRK